METILVQTENCNIFVDEFDGDVWVNFMSNESSKRIIITSDEARKLVSALNLTIEFVESA